MQVIWCDKTAIRLGTIHDPYTPFEVPDDIYSLRPSLHHRLKTPERYEQELREMDDAALRGHARRRGLRSAGTMAINNVLDWCLACIRSPLDVDPVKLVDEEPAVKSVDERITSIDELKADAWRHLEAEDYQACKSSCYALEIEPASWKKQDVFEALQDYLLSDD